MLARLSGTKEDFFWQGDILVDDPEGKVIAARFFSVEEAVPLLEVGLRRRIMREPIVASLQGTVGPGAFWYYRASEHGEEEFLERHGSVIDR